MTDKAKYEIISIFESSMPVDPRRRLSSVFNISLLNHIIAFEMDDDEDIETERVEYRITIEARKP